jgi:hypothetical protein
MQFRDRSIATLQIENNSKFLSSFLERGQDIMEIPRSATAIELEARHHTLIHHRTRTRTPATSQMHEEEGEIKWAGTRLVTR